MLKLYPTWAIVDMMQCQGMYAGDYPMSDYRDHPVSWYGCLLYTSDAADE